jgi:hypothetical protein
MGAKSQRTTIARPGDHLVVESERVGQRPREGEILEVAESKLGVSYDVRWEDGHQSSFRPAAGSTRIIPARSRGRSSR